MGSEMCIRDSPEPTASPAMTETSATSAPTRRTPVPTRTPRAKPTDTATPVPTSPPTITPTPKPVIPADKTYITRRLVKMNVSPSQARIFLNGRYIGIADDWDDGGGGSLLTFTSDGRYRIRLAYPGRKDLNVDVVVAANVAKDRVEIEGTLEKLSLIHISEPTRPY